MGGFPALRGDHPGFYTVCLGLVVTHVGLTIDALMPDRHASPIWSVMDGLLPHFWLWGVIHLLVVLLIVVGVYGAADTSQGFQQFYLLRVGAMISALSFNALGVALFFGALQNHLSFYPAFTSIALSMMSMAAFREPRFNPTSTQMKTLGAST